MRHVINGIKYVVLGMRVQRRRLKGVHTVRDKSCEDEGAAQGQEEERGVMMIV